MKPIRALTFPLLFGTLSLSLACSGAAEDDLGESSLEKRVKPRGSQTAGKLKVVPPLV